MKVLSLILISVGGVISIVVLAIVIYQIIWHRRNNPVLIPKQMDAKQTHSFPKSKLRLSNYNGGLEYSFNFWIYIKSMDYRYGEEKIILFWKGKGKGVESTKIKCKTEQIPNTMVDNINTGKDSRRILEIKESCPFCKNASPLGPETFIGGYETYDNLIGSPTLTDVLEPFESTTVPKTSGQSGIIVAISPEINELIVRQSLLNGQEETLHIPKLPLQKWLHIAIILKQRYLDVFVNGKLITSRHLKSIPIYDSSRLSVNPNGGFGGFISRLQYHNHSITIQDVRHHFKQGPPTDMEYQVSNSTSS